MEKFSYKASNAAGKIIKGTIPGENRQVVFMQLKKKGLYPVEVSVVREINVSFDFLSKWQKISKKEVLFFIIQLSTMIKSGISLIVSFDIIINQTKNKKLKKIFTEIRAEISKGKNLSEACNRYPEAFPPLFSNIVRAGEESGKLELVLDRYAGFVKNSNKINSEIKSAMAYPAILVVLSICVMIFLTTFIVPTFADMLKASGTELPGSTKLLLNFSAFMKNNCHYVLLATILSIFSLCKYIKTESGSYYYDLLKLKIPILGKLIFKITISRFIRTMSTLLSSGVPFLKNLKLANNVINNRAITKKFKNLYDNIAMGKSIARQFDKTEVFSPIAIQMITIGENSGKLDQMFDEIAELYDREIETSVKRLTTSLEPLVLIVVASGVGFIAVSLVSAVMKAVSTLN